MNASACYPVVLFTHVIAVISLLGCGNQPPLYEQNARRFLQRQGALEELTSRLVERKQLTEDEVHYLISTKNVAVLHLVGSNPSTPEVTLRQLARHDDFEVRTGVAQNSTAPLDLLLRLRTPGRYTTVNDHLAGNPQVPREVLVRMHAGREASLSSFAMNINCSSSIMEDIVVRGRDIDRAWLASNPNLTPALAERLASDHSSLVRQHLRDNRKYAHLVPRSASGQH